MSPKRKLCERQRDARCAEGLFAGGFHPWIATFLSGRLDHPISLGQCMQPGIASIADPESIPDMKVAVDRIVRAILSNEKILFAVDHDMDGQASGAVLWGAFTACFGVPPSRLGIVTSHRLNEGYGITDAVADRIICSDASLVITADKGSSDEQRIRRIREAGKDVVVTDHHEIPAEGPPESAIACVNPTRKESTYDRSICGAAVAFLTMAKVRSELILRGVHPTLPSVASLVDYVAVATIADCVALRPDRAFINRALVKRGLSLINLRARPCWSVFREEAGDHTITSQDIAFRLAPAIAAAGRLDWADAGFRFLTATQVDEARDAWAILKSENTIRKELEKDLRRRAIQCCQSISGRSISLYFEDGHSGVHGITASRIAETFGKPVAIFAPKGAGARDESDYSRLAISAGMAAGSFRSVPNLNIRDVLQSISSEHPGLLVAFGGHAAAAGATVRIPDMERFAAAFESAVTAHLRGAEPVPELWTDGSLDDQQLSLEFVDLLAALDPWGKDFPVPTFVGEFRVKKVRRLGDGTHLRIDLESGGRRIEAVWFDSTAPDAEVPISEGTTASFAYRIGDNCYRGSRTFQMQVVSLIERL